MVRRKWTAQEDEIMRELYADTCTTELARSLNRSIGSLHSRANILRIRKTKEYIAERSRKASMDPRHPGRKYRFKKGCEAWNKGMTQKSFMSEESIERTKGTRFKKGNRPKNYRPVGSTRVNVDGYVEVKVSDPSHWELLHRKVWRDANGEIPDGYNIQFRDGNKQNISLANLYMINKENQMRENSIQQYPKEVKSLIFKLGKLNKLIKKNEQQTIINRQS